ncbi:hypothetical protein ACES2L_11160 [Bdellovibrio bacteriovorus]
MKRAVLGIAISLFLSTAFAAIPPYQSGMDVRSQRSLRQQVDSYVKLLEQEVQTAQSQSDRFKFINQVLTQIKTLRDNGAPQSALDDTHMDLVVTVLESIPKERDFKRNRCLTYENDLLNQFEPTAEDNPTEPAVKPGWNVLQSLCS